jgi:hypothetical protein
MEGVDGHDDEGDAQEDDVQRVVHTLNDTSIRLGCQGVSAIGDGQPLALLRSLVRSSTY